MRSETQLKLSITHIIFFLCITSKSVPEIPWSEIPGFFPLCPSAFSIRVIVVKMSKPWGLKNGNIVSQALTNSILRYSTAGNTKSEAENIVKLIFDDIVSEAIRCQCLHCKKTGGKNRWTFFKNQDCIIWIHLHNYTKSLKLIN